MVRAPAPVWVREPGLVEVWEMVRGTALAQVRALDPVRAPAPPRPPGRKSCTAARGGTAGSRGTADREDTAGMPSSRRQIAPSLAEGTAVPADWASVADRAGKAVLAAYVCQVLPSRGTRRKNCFSM
jgi:hypothetical protein